MSRRSRHLLAPNLFPFLAVLVCTMGTLILLLGLVSQDAAESAEQVVASETKATSIQTDDQRWRAEELEKLRARHTAALEQRRSELAHLEDHLRRIREQMAELADETKAAESPADETTERSAARLVALRSRIDEEKEKLATLEQEQARRPPRVVILPYKGPNGTDRRPVYVECTDQAVIIQPEGVRITAAHLEGPLGPGNPLDAALRAVRDHWQQTDPGSPPPYPLLLVRPGGIHAYAACRTAMTAWDDQFGYELIPADLPLAFPAADAELHGKLVQTIDEAAQRQRAKIAAMPSRHPGLSREAIAASDTAGSSHRGGARSGTPGGSAQRGGTAAPASGRESLAYAGRESAAGAGMENGWDLSTSPGGAALGSPGSDGLATDGRGAGGLQTDGGPSQSGMLNEGGSASLANGASGGSARGIGTPGTAATLRGPKNAPGSEPTIALAPGATTAPGGGSLLDSTSPSSDGELTAADHPNPPAADLRANASDASMPAGDGGAAGSVAADASNPLGGQGGTESRGQIIGSGGSGAGAEGPRSGLNASAGGAPTPSISSPTPSERFDPHAKTFSEAAPRFTPSTGGGKSSSSETPVLRAGNNWAMPDSVRNNRGTSIVRQMRMRCEADRFVLLPESRSSGAMTIISIPDGASEEAVLELATALRDRVEGWGLAMQNGRWEPVLSVEVGAGAEARYAELQSLLRGSGIRVEREVPR